MTTNKEIIRKVNQGFVTGDQETILSYVADDVRWDIAGVSTHIGKEAFRKEINNENFIGLPAISVKNEIEEGDHVAVEGSVQCRKKDGGMLDALFFDFYRLENGKIKEMRSYVVQNSSAANNPSAPVTMNSEIPESGVYYSSLVPINPNCFYLVLYKKQYC
jgi:uncharacterized protein